MTTINPHYTFNYVQPDEYRFSHDSVFLARMVFDLCRQEDWSERKGLDLCAGCGIVGLDFLFHCRAHSVQLPKSFDFLEVQEIYSSYFYSNLNKLGEISTQIQWLNENYQVLLTGERQYDLILANPPYFLKDKGVLSPSEFKNRCRFFIDSDFKNLILGVQKSLTPSGVAYLLLRDLSEQGWHVISQTQKYLQPGFVLSIVGDIRGTYCAKIQNELVEA